jgi:hypothetical protein
LRASVRPTEAANTGFGRVVDLTKRFITKVKLVGKTGYMVMMKSKGWHATVRHPCPHQGRQGIRRGHSEVKMNQSQERE